MTAKAFAADLFEQHDQYCLHHLHPFDCTHARVQPELQSLVAHSNGLLTSTHLGDSLEGRRITMITCGRGKIPVLLWSQMHGDETTATLGLVDMFSFLVHAGEAGRWIRAMLDEVTIHAIPLLNPDGAERRQRHTAAQIDMNRDARAEVTPEAKILRAAHRKLSPSFGYNLHDQALSSVGDTDRVAALAFLAPAKDAARSAPLSRVRAMRVVAYTVSVLEQFAKKHFTSYDDDFEPRAFGDRMQSWGTSTILIESGHWPKDPEKKFIRKLNFVALLVGLNSIANKSYNDTELELYTALPKNGKRMYHYIIRDLEMEHTGGWTHRADIGLEVEEKSNGEEAHAGSSLPRVVVKEIGDLKGFGALETIEGGGRRVRATSLTLETTLPLSQLLDTLQIYYGR